MSENVSFEVLVAKDIGEEYEVIGTSYSNTFTVESDSIPLCASFLTIQRVKELLRDGKTIHVPKEIEFPEYTQKDLIIIEDSELDNFKKKCINKVVAEMQHVSIGMSILDAMTYLDSYMKLLASGIFITNKNREEKYIEIIEASQLVKEPEPINENSTFEEEQKYFEQKKKYTDAQEDLETLETYLKSYDSISKIEFIVNTLKKVKSDISNATTKEEVENAMKEYEQIIKKFGNVPKV